MDFDAIFQQIDLNLSRKLYALQNLVAKTPLPESFGCLLDPQRTAYISEVHAVHPDVIYQTRETVGAYDLQKPSGWKLQA